MSNTALIPVRIRKKQFVSAIVDADMLEDLSRFHWRLSAYGYAYRQTLRGGIRRSTYMHRVVLGLGPDDEREGDHIDRNKLNNVRSNLRPLSHLLNSSNRPKCRNNTSGFKGVYRDAEGRGWRAEIQVGRKYRLGRFATPEAAARAYDRKARELLGDLAVLNFPEDQS